MTEQELDVLTRTLWGEARGEGMAGMVAVGWVVRNRAARPGWWGTSILSVCLKPWQFSCWNKTDPNYAYMSGDKPIPAAQYARCRAAAELVQAATVDPTGGATHYYWTGIPAPDWAARATLTAHIGSHLFFKDVP